MSAGSPLQLPIADMRNQNVQLMRICSTDLKKHQPEFGKLSVTHFADNPIQTLLPVPENEREEFYSLQVEMCRNVLVLAYHDNELVGFCTGSILKYKACEEVSQNNERLPRGGSQGDIDV